MSDYRKEMTTGEYSRNPNSFYYPPPPLPELQAHPHDQQALLPLGPHYGYIPPCPEGDNINDDAKSLASLRRDDGFGGSDGTTSTQRNHSGLTNASVPMMNYHHNYHFNHHYGGIMLPPSSHDNQYYRPQMQFAPTNQTWVTPNDAVQTNESSSPPPLYSTEAPSILAGSSGSSDSQLSQASSSEATAIGRPAPAKSAFMCFFEERKRTKDGAVEAAAIEWQRLSHNEKAHWEGVAENEKVRYKIEREALCKNNNGPLARKLRAKKDPVSKRSREPEDVIHHSFTLIAIAFLLLLF